MTEKDIRPALDLPKRGSVLRQLDPEDNEFGPPYYVDSYKVAGKIGPGDPVPVTGINIVSLTCGDPKKPEGFPHRRTIDPNVLVSYKGDIKL